MRCLQQHNKLQDNDVRTRRQSKANTAPPRRSARGLPLYSSARARCLPGRGSEATGGSQESAGAGRQEPPKTAGDAARAESCRWCRWCRSTTSAILRSLRIAHFVNQPTLQIRRFVNLRSFEISQPVPFTPKHQKSYRDTGSFLSQ